MSSRVGTQAPQLSEYLEKLQGTTFRKLYLQPSAAFAIFRRMLPPLAKSLVLRMLYMPSPLLLSDLDTWVMPEAKKEKDQAVMILKSLHMVQISPQSKEKMGNMYLATNFKNSLRLVLEGGGSHNSFGVSSPLPVPPEIDVAFLDRYARKKREDILHFVVNSVGIPACGGGGYGDSGSQESGGGPKASVKDLLLAGELVERLPGGRGVGITQAGFTFLLQDPNAQLWTLLFLWLKAMEVSGGSDTPDPVDMLSFLFMLATAELGRAYDISSLTEQRKNMLPFLADFGLIYIPQAYPQQYLPTRLATTLTSGAASLRSLSAGFSAAATGGGGGNGDGAGGMSSSADSQRGSIILETNFRIYAYTSSPLQIAVLALFSQLRMRFPDMVMGRLTRQSIRRAISFGITADQIVGYLAAHAHDEMRRASVSTGRPVLPPTVVDQIRLWQLENERMRVTSGFLLKDFDSNADYEAVAAYADEIGVLVWRGDAKRMFFASSFQPIRDFMKLRKKTD